MEIIKFDIALERYFGAGHQAHRHVGFAGRSEPTGYRLAEPRGDKLVADRGWAGRYVLQTVITHTGSP
jgi:hypothetical protein